MLYNDDWDETLQSYAVDLLVALRQRSPDQWSKDWRNDAFLGTAADVALRYDLRYEAVRRAFEAAEPPPAELRVRLARCYMAPGEARVTEDDAIGLLEAALDERPLAEAAEMLENIYRLRGDSDAEKRWEKRLVTLRSEGEEMRPLEPAALAE